MDTAYDHIQEETIAAEEQASSHPEPGDGPANQPSDLGTEFREAYEALSSSAWGARIGGFFGQVKKQGETYYAGARQELSAASAEASRGWSGLLNNTRAFSFGQASPPASAAPTTATDDTANAATDTPAAAESAEASTTPTAPSASQSLPADIVKEAEAILSRFKTDAAARLKQVQAAEDAADAALERFGTNIKNFLRDAVTISPPMADDDDSSVKREMLFESKDMDGKRVVHATRFDAQLHVIHSTLSSFTSDPESEEFAGWKAAFDVEKKTEAIAKDLDRYDELRRAMDKLVPEQVPYADFWTRYYFLRHVIETEERKRRELLQGTHLDEEQVAWDDDEEDEGDDVQPGTPNAQSTPRLAAIGAGSTKSSAAARKPADLLKPNEPRRSNEQSVADSDASYDIVSGATSRGPDSPKEDITLTSEKKPAAAKGAEESDEEDWE